MGRTSKAQFGYVKFEVFAIWSHDNEWEDKRVNVVLKKSLHPGNFMDGYLWKQIF